MWPRCGPTVTSLEGAAKGGPVLLGGRTARSEPIFVNGGLAACIRWQEDAGGAAGEGDEWLAFGGDGCRLGRGVRLVPGEPASLANALQAQQQRKGLTDVDGDFPGRADGKRVTRGRWSPFLSSGRSRH